MLIIIGVLLALFLFQVHAVRADTPDTLNLDPIWQNMANGDFFGFFQACYLFAWVNPDVFYGVISMLFLVPLYIRTKSLILICIIWILIGSLIVVAMPIVSTIAILFMALGIGGLLFKLVRPSY